MADTKAKFIITAVDATKAAFNSIKTGLGSVTSVAATLGATLSAGAFVAWTKGMIDAADELNDLSQRVGVGIKELAGYKLAAEQSGTSLETVAKGIKGLAVYMTAHSKNLKDAGIQAKTTDEMMVKLADIFEKMPNGLEKTALSVKLFGKAGADLIPMLNLGSKGLQEAKEKAEAYGKKMEELAPLADEFNDQLAELKLASTAVGLSLTRSMLPPMIGIAKAMAKAAKEGSTLKTLWVGFGGIGAQIFNPLSAAIKQVGASASEAGAEFNEFLASFTTGNARQAFLKTAIQERQNAKRIYAEIAALGDGLGLDTPSRGGENKSTAPDAKADDAKKDAEKKALAVAEAAKKAADTYNQLTQSIAEYQAQLNAQEEKQGKLTKADELAIQVKLKLTAAQVAQLKPALDKIAADERELELQQAIDKRAADNLANAEKETASIRDQVIAQNEHNATIGLTTEQLGALEIARIDEQIAAKQTLLSIFSENDGRSAQVLEIKAQVDALNELNSAKREGAARQTIAENVKKNAEEWKRFTDDIESSLTDALLRGFEGGKDGGKNFVDSLKNTLKTAALKIVVQAIVNPVMGSVQGALSSGGVSIGGGGGSSGFGGLSLPTYGLSSVISGIGTLTGSASISAFGAGIGLTSAEAAAASAAYGSAGLGSVGSSLTAGSALGAALPWVGGALAIGSALGLFGGKGGGAKIEGDAKFSLAGNASNYAGDTSIFPTTEGNAQIRDFLTVPLNNLQETIKQLGGTLNSTVHFGFDADPKGSAQSRVKSVIDGTTLSGGTNYGRTEAELQAGMTKELERLLIAAFDKANFDPATKGMISVLRSAGVAIQDLAGTLVPLRAAFASLGLPVSSLTKELVDTFGGLGNLASGLSGFYENFYSASEKYTAALGNISSTLKSLGVSVIPSTREEYRRLVEAQDLNTSAGRAMYASLIAVSGAFAGVIAVTDDAANSVADAARNLSTDKFKTRADYIYAQRTGILPKYAAGGDHAGGWAIVGEQGPELANLGPSRIYSNSNSRALLDTTALQNEIAALRNDLRASQAAMAHSLKILEKKVKQWDGDGMPPVRA